MFIEPASAHVAVEIIQVTQCLIAAASIAASVSLRAGVLQMGFYHTDQIRPIITIPVIAVIRPPVSVIWIVLPVLRARCGANQNCSCNQS
jgi:hypothetical protein